MVKQFIQNFREAFGQKATLPLLFGYSNQPVADTERINGCFFKGLQAAREGAPVSLSAEVIACGGGKLYTGFTDMPERVPGFVSLKEKYKKTPQMVIDYVEDLGMKRAEQTYLNFVMPRPTCFLVFVAGLSSTRTLLMLWSRGSVRDVVLLFR